MAETLITLTIIGVIAALTIPNLLNKYTKHTYVIGLKKAYSQLQHAVKMIPITEGCSAGDYDCAGMFQGTQYIDGQFINTPVTNIDGMDFGGRSSFKQTYLLSKQFKTQEVILQNDSDKCIINSLFGTVPPCFITNDGMIFYSYSGSDIHVDINGRKQPNKWGRDQFAFEMMPTDYKDIKQGTLLPYGSKLYDKYHGGEKWGYWTEYCKPGYLDYSYNGQYCTGRVLEEDAMNY